MRRVESSDFRLPDINNTSNSGVLRRPVESAQYLSIKYAERLAEAGIEPSVGSVGDSYPKFDSKGLDFACRGYAAHVFSMG